MNHPLQSETGAFRMLQVSVGACAVVALVTSAGGESSIRNAGTIRTPEGGHVYLIAPNVENQASGVINAPNGEVVIAAGRSVELVSPVINMFPVESNATWAPLSSPPPPKKVENTSVAPVGLSFARNASVCPTSPD